MYEMKNSIKFSFPSPIEVHINIILSRIFSFLRKRKKGSKKIPERIGLKRIIILKMKLETGGGKKIIKAWLGIRENLIHDKFPPPLKLFNVSLGGMNCQTFSLPPLENTPISWQKKKKNRIKEREEKGEKGEKQPRYFLDAWSVVPYSYFATWPVGPIRFITTRSIHFSLSLARSLAHSLSFSFSLSALQTNELFIDNNTDGSRNNPVGDWNKPLRLAARFLNANQVSQNVSK